jgi:hypothetical protein
MRAGGPAEAGPPRDVLRGQLDHRLLRSDRGVVAEDLHGHLDHEVNEVALIDGLGVEQLDPVGVCPDGRHSRGLAEELECELPEEVRVARVVHHLTSAVELVLVERDILSAPVEHEREVEVQGVLVVEPVHDLHGFLWHLSHLVSWIDGCMDRPPPQQQDANTIAQLSEKAIQI